MRTSNLSRAGTLSLLAAIACGSDPTTGPIRTPDGLEISTALTDATSAFTVFVDVKNVGSGTRTVSYPSNCDPYIELHVHDDNGSPVWSERQWREGNGICLGVSRSNALAPGDVIETIHTVENGQVLGDSLTAGTYRIRIRMILAEPDTTLVVDGGTVTLEGA